MKLVWIPLNLHKILRRIAFEEESTIQGLTETAIREYLERRGVEIPPEALKESAIAS